MIMIYPTDTVWGIGASIFNKDATSEVHRIKNSDQKKPMSVLFQSPEQINQFLSLDVDLKDFPLIEILKIESTVLIPLKYFKIKIPDFIYCGSDKIGVRLADSILSNQLSQFISDPITTTSLNRSSEPPILDEDCAKSFKEEYAPEAIFIPGEKKTLSGSPSTIISLEEGNRWSIIREGARKSELESLLGI